MPFELLKSVILYPGRAFTIRCDTLRLPNGRETKFNIVEHVDSVVVIPVDDKGNLIFVRQYRHAAGQDLLEFPAGTLNEGETPEACARREIREETGMAAGNLEELGRFYLAPGYSTEYMYAYLATDLHSDPLEADTDEFLTIERFPLTEALASAARGDIPDAKSLAALFMAQSRLEKLI